MTRRAILPEDYDFLSNRATTFEQQENMTVVPNYDVVDGKLEAIKVMPGVVLTPEQVEIDYLRSRLTSVEQELAEARKDSERLEFLFEEWAAHHVKDNETGEQNYRLDYETGWCMTYRGAIDAEMLPAARSSSDQEGR